MTQSEIEFSRSPSSKLPFSPAVRVGNVLYLSGALGNVPGKMEVVPRGIAAETRQMMQNIANTLEQNGLSFNDVFKCQVFLADMNLADEVVRHSRQQLHLVGSDHDLDAANGKLRGPAAESLGIAEGGHPLR